MFDQETFVNTLVETISRTVINDIREGRISRDWDGIELRQLLADRFTSAVYKMEPRRKREYNNAVLVNNL